MSPRIEQDLALQEEIDTATRLIRNGLRQLQRVDNANAFYHLPMLLLSSGFERLTKAIICLQHLRDQGEYPTDKDVCFTRGKTGHDLGPLLKRIRTTLFEGKYLGIPAAKADLEHLNDQTLQKVVAILSDFGMSARYYNLNVVLSIRNETESPDDEWQKMERLILKGNPELHQQFLADPISTGVYPYITTRLVMWFEILARALARLFTIGGLGEKARQFSAPLHQFLFLTDSDIGKTTY